MVGIGGGAPTQDNDIRLGDIIVSQPTGLTGGVIQYDFGKAIANGGFERIGSLNAPPPLLLSALSSVKAMNPVDIGRTIAGAIEKLEKLDTRFYLTDRTDLLFDADYHHVAGSKSDRTKACEACDVSNLVARPKRQYDHPYIHYGIIGSGSQVIKDGVKRSKITAETGVLCFEMEAAGLHDFQYLVVRGVCDYSDTHKNDRWQPYAALVAAIYTKELLLEVPPLAKNEIGHPGIEQEKIRTINFVIPFDMRLPRYRNFTGREDELRDIDKYFTESTAATPRIFAITGTGGMGKTQIAIEYAYRYHTNFTAVLWVSAASEETIRASFLDIMQTIVTEQARTTWPESVPNYKIIGAKLGIPGLISETGTINTKPDAADQIQSALFRWLRLPRSEDPKWLLIFDNVDDLENFDIQRYFPSHGNGCILVTSRRPEFSQSAQQMDLDGLDEENAVKLLLTLSGKLSSQEDIIHGAISIVEALGFMPLAISHAGCYINQTKRSFKEYLGCYHEAFKVAQSCKPRFGWNYREDTAITTWEVSFAEIKKQDEQAASLLLVCSYLDPEEIFEGLWEGRRSIQSSDFQIHQDYHMPMAPVPLELRLIDELKSVIDEEAFNLDSLSKIVDECQRMMDTYSKLMKPSDTLHEGDDILRERIDLLREEKDLLRKRLALLHERTDDLSKQSDSLRKQRSILREQGAILRGLDYISCE
ncbi:hypothetical protein TWF696_005389 [Orbilia brochopaga]|uniref:NB-ARC domain-containing protein n=1 Tax=Orbilia brochopaga TaxID=3140254 RepID=A0AAV9V3X3_9PEZI